MNWHYLEKGQQHGPVSEADFSALVGQGVIRPETPIWCEGMTEWKPYGELLAAAASVKASPAPYRARIVPEPAEGTTATREATCSHCGAVVSASEIMTVGSAQLCPPCQAAHRRLSLGEKPPLAYAPAWLRLVAYLLDVALCLLVAAGLFVGGLFALDLAGVPKESKGLATLGVLAVALFWVLDYFVGRIARRGATPMMRAFKLEVVTAAGGPVGGWRAWGRFLMILLVNQFTLGLGHLPAFFDKQHRALHDLACGTVVIQK
jgi:uncharacterized RDD family membrane protein YckC